MSKTSKVVIGLIAVLQILTLAVTGYNTVAVYHLAQDTYQTLGITHLTGLEISGAETDALVVNQTSSGDIAEFRDNGTVVWRLADGGLVSQLGACVDLDADGDTSICADTDDQIDFELGGADIFVMNEWGADSIVVTTTEHLIEIQDSTPIITGETNSLAALNIDLGIGNSTGGTNSIYAMLIDGITADAQNTETAINVGDGWDVDLNGTTDFVIGVDGNTFLTLTDPPAAGSSGDLIDLTDTFGIMNGSDAVIGIDINLTGANHTGSSNTLTAIDIDLTTADADATETALGIDDTDFDIGIDSAINLEHMVLPTVASAAIAYNSSGALWTVGATEVWFIHAMYCNITTNFDSGGSNDNTVDIGTGDDTDGFLNLDDAELQTSDTEGTGAPAGWQGFMSTDVVGAYLTNGLGFVLSNDTIDIATGGTGADAGAGTCYIIYTRIQ